MLLNLGLNRLAPSLDPSLRKAPNIVTAPKSNIDVNAILGLTPSQYSGLQNVRDTGYYYGNNRMYEPYTITSSPSYGIYGPYGGFGYGPYGANQSNSNRAEGTLEIGSQAFRPVDVDVTGFSKNKVGEEGSEIYEYTPSMAYVYANTPRPAPVQTPNQMSFLSSPTPSVSYNGNYGASRFLNTGNLLGFNFGTPSGQTTGGQATP
jgi:hypothetical protein